MCPKRLSLLASVLAACAAPAEDTGDDEAYALPPFGGCSVTQVVDVIDYADNYMTYGWTYDADERLARYTETDRDGLVILEQTWAYDDAGCVVEAVQVEREEEDVYRTVEAYTCADGLPTAMTYTSGDDGDDAPWVRTYTYTHVVQGGLPVLTTRVSDLGQVYRESLSWHDGALAGWDTWAEELWLERGTISRDETGLLLAYTLEQPSDPWNSYRLLYDHDEHDRVSELVYEEGEDFTDYTYVERLTWHDDMFMPLRDEYDEYDDGTVDIAYDWACEGPWPYACAVEVTFADEEGGLQLGQTWDYAWSCP